MSLTAKKVYAILNGKIVKINGIIETIKHPVIYQGSVKNESELPQNNEIGWMYNIQEKSSYGEAGMNVVWTKDGWDAMGGNDRHLFILRKNRFGRLGKATSKAFLYGQRSRSSSRKRINSN